MNESQILGRNLRQIRLEKGYSLGQLADLCGVSKMVLSQIERGDSNPTLSTIWKIAVGLGIPYTALLENQAPAPSILHRSTVPCIYDDSSLSSHRTYYSSSDMCPFDFFTVEMKPGSSKSSVHTAGSREYVYVEEGSLELTVGDATVSMITGDSMQFDGSLPHTYVNPSKTVLKIISILTY